MPDPVSTARRARRAAFSITWLALAAVVAGTALLTEVGADARWFAALGEQIVSSKAIPAGLPYAGTAADGWHNAPVLGEIVFFGLEKAFSDRGLILAQVVAVTIAFVALARDMRNAGATDAARGLTLIAAAVAAAPTLFVARAQLFSLALLPLLVLLLRSESRSPSRRIWLAVPLVAVWANLHGGVLLGVAVIAAYVLFDRSRHDRLVAVGVLASSLTALLATPALLGTAAYYHDVLTSEAAKRGFGLWAPLSPHAPFDVIFLAVGTPLLLAALRTRVARWELAVLLGLAAMSVHAGRNAVWLVFFAAVPAACALEWNSRGGRVFERLTLAGAGGLAAVAAFAVAQAPAQTAAGAALVRQTAAAAAGTPVLADALNAEELALAGQQIRIGNPLDAFGRTDQRAYLDWLEGEPLDARLIRDSCAVLVMVDSRPQLRLAHDPGFRELARDAEAVLYRRTGCAAR